MVKLCECGCGQPTKIITKTDNNRGRIKGRYNRFVKNHNPNPIKGKTWEEFYGVKKARELKALKIKQLFCDKSDCNEKHYGKGLCCKHYRKYYREKYPEYYKNYCKQHEKELKKKIKESSKKYRESHKKYMSDYQKKYRKTLKGKANISAYHHNRRMLTKDLTKEIVQKVYADNIKKYGILTCYLCGKPIVFGDERLRDSLDHSTPVTREGSNNYENLGIAHLTCNLQKHTMTLNEWRERDG